MLKAYQEMNKKCGVRRRKAVIAIDSNFHR